jgi:RNA polymerase sigma-70 factor (ECF subfamily)
MPSRNGALAMPHDLPLGTAETRGQSSLEDALVDLYEQLRPAVVAYVYHLIGSVQDSDDIVQTAFLRLHMQFQRSVRIENLRSWIYRVVHNLAMDYLRQVKVERAATERIAATPVEVPYDSPEAALIRRDEIEMAFRSLNERERRCLMLRAQGLTYSEIGDVLGISAKAVSVYLVRGLRKFAPERP